MGKIRKNIINLPSAELVQRVVKVKNFLQLQRDTILAKHKSPDKALHTESSQGFLSLFKL